MLTGSSTGPRPRRSPPSLAVVSAPVSRQCLVSREIHHVGEHGDVVADFLSRRACCRVRHPPGSFIAPRRPCPTKALIMTVNADRPENKGEIDG